MSDDKQTDQHDISDEDRALFSSTVGKVTPVHHDRIVPERHRPASEPLQHLNDESRVMDELLTHEIDPEVMITGEEIGYRRPGIQHRVMKQLRQGQYRIQAELDLHRMNSEAARRSIEHFIQQSHADGLSCVLIIHGKGLRSKNTGPVLKDLTASLLPRQRPVMAFASARPVDGGTGAVYVLLRRK